MFKHFLFHTTQRELLNIEGQTESTPVDKYIFTWTTKGVRSYPKFQL